MFGGESLDEDGVEDGSRERWCPRPEDRTGKDLGLAELLLGWGQARCAGLGPLDLFHRVQ